VKRVLAIGGLLLISVSACAFSSGIKGISLSGKVGYSYLLYAKESFRAVTGSPGGFIYGAGAKVDLPYGLRGGLFQKIGKSGLRLWKQDLQDRYSAYFLDTRGYRWWRISVISEGEVLPLCGGRDGVLPLPGDLSG